MTRLLRIDAFMCEHARGDLLAGFHSDRSKSLVSGFSVFRLGRIAEPGLGKCVLHQVDVVTSVVTQPEVLCGS